MVSNITPDIVDSPPSKPSPTPRLTTCRTLRRSHDAVAMYSVSIANRKQASIFDTNVPTTNGEPFTDGSSRSVMLEAGDYAVNPPGVWHTADVTGHATAIFITAGEGTQHRPR